MSWSFLLILVPTICYAAASAVYASHGNGALAVVYAGYSFSNLGFLYLDRTLK